MFQNWPAVEIYVLILSLLKFSNANNTFPSDNSLTDVHQDFCCLVGVGDDKCIILS